MNCPKCNGKLSVVDSRAASNNSTRRRVECTQCGDRFSSLETIIPSGDHVKTVTNIELTFRKLAKKAIVYNGYTSTLTGKHYLTKEEAERDTIAELERIYNEQ